KARNAVRSALCLPGLKAEVSRANLMNRHIFASLVFCSSALISADCMAEKRYPAVNSGIDYNVAAVCDFIYARLYDASGRLSQLASEKLADSKLYSKDGIVVYRLKTDSGEIDFNIIDDERKIISARVYPTGFLLQDRRKAKLLSRLGVSHPGNVKLFRARCDMANLEISFSKDDMLDAKIFF
ncbi:MAG: hypothetical protein K2X55_09955, partial [Burkholderiaceae bacterium]|nr:hypothetical protein [Burkholderiaceae bacterium]